LSPNLLLLLLFIAAFTWSAIRPFNRGTWWMEASAVLVGGAALILLRFWVRLSTFAYGLFLIHAFLILVGAHYSYPRVPWFEWLKAKLQIRRNHFDRLVHCMMGVMGTMVGRELLIRLTPIKAGAWLFLLSMALNLSLACLTEVGEFVVARAKGAGASTGDFLGFQGDEWDTHWDMTLAFGTGLIAYLLLGPWQDLYLRGFR
jgi:putative membrane protein